MSGVTTYEDNSAYDGLKELVTCDAKLLLYDQCRTGLRVLTRRHVLLKSLLSYYIKAGLTLA